MRRGAAILLAATVLLLAQSHRERAARFYEERRFSEAARELEEHLRSRPDDLQARLLLGLSRQQAGDLPEAEAAFEGAVKLWPGSATAHYSLARVRFLRAKFDAARRSAEDARRLGEPPARVEHLLGLIDEEEGLPDRALKHFRLAEKADPRFEPARASHAALLLKLRDPREAERLLQQGIESADGRYLRGRARLDLGNSQAAREDLAAAANAGHEPAKRLLEQLEAGGVLASSPKGPVAPDAPPARFQEVAASMGLRFRLENHPTPRKHLIETMTGGVAAFDIDNDGWTDLFFANGAEIPSLRKSEPKYWNRLFRNIGGKRFADVTESWGAAGEGYSMGAAAGDFDNDGFTDLFVAGVGRGILYRNRGDRFEDVTRASGILLDTWAVAGGWFDYDRDGLLDLFVVNYVKWSPDFDLFCGDRAAGFRVYCHPKHFDGLPNRLYRNLGGGRFRDVSASSGIAAHKGKGMSLAFADYDGNGFADVFVTNDTLGNFLFRNRGDGKFEEVGLTAGVALRDDGKPVSSMGVDFRDYDNDGLPDIAVTALAGETFPLFRNQGKGFFRDATDTSGLSVLSGRRSGWGVALADFNNDGWKDLFTANSHVTDNIGEFSKDRYLLPNSLFVNTGAVFRDQGVPFPIEAAHRGSAVADFDNDGRLDVAVSVLGGSAELWRNATAGPQQWVRLKLEGTRSNRSAIGARVRLGRQWNEVTSSAGYTSSALAGVHFGLGVDSGPGEVEVLWPGGPRQTPAGASAGRVIAVREPTR